VDNNGSVQSESGLSRVAIKPGLYAIRHINNWDGEGDVCNALAQLDDKGHWTLEESGAPVLVYAGDMVLSAWPLNEDAAVKPFESLSTDERIQVLERELAGQPLKAWNVHWTQVVAARSARQAVEVFIAHSGEWNRETYNISAADACELVHFQLQMKPVEAESADSFQALLNCAKGPCFLGLSK
jgi:hypothetical protein